MRITVEPKGTISRLLILMGLVFAIGLVVTLVAHLPGAMAEETHNQRAVAAGQWRHHVGYGEYVLVTENNK